MRLDPFYQRFRAGLAQAKERLSSTPSPKAAASPPPPHYLRGEIKAEDLIDTPLYRAYSELNGGRPLPRFDAEVTWGNDLANDVLARQLGQPFATLSDDTLVLLRVKSVYEGSQEVLAAEDAFAAYCLLNGALSRDDSGQTPLEYLLFLIEHIPVPKEDLPQLAIEGKIPIS